MLSVSVFEAARELAHVAMVEMALCVRVPLISILVCAYLQEYKWQGRLTIFQC